ncbi:MAG TPA: hypothetical protein VEI97_16590, partial [bacterium]|nr:hypothetical protein [bacterium]
MVKAYAFLLLLGLLGGARPTQAAFGPGGARADTGFVRQIHRRIVFQFDQRYSLVNERLVAINGVKLGVEWRGRYRAGAGLYFLSPAVRAVSPERLLGAERAELRLRYAALYGEYVLRGTPRW